MTYNLTDDWDVTGGLRWSRDEKDAFIDHTNAAGNGFVVGRLVFPPASPGDQQRSESKVTWSLNTRYELSDDVMAFLTSSTGFKSGGFNSRRLPEGAVVEFGPEESITFEGGIKSFWWDRRVMLNVTLFHTTIEGFQESTLAPTGTGFIVGNAGEQEVSGLETDFMLTPNENLAINGALAYLDAQYTDFSDAPCGAGETPDNPNGTCNRNGERAWLTFGQTEYQRLANIAVAHLYNLRRSNLYSKQRRQFGKARSKPSTIGERRKPQPDDKLGYIRVDTVHQGDLDGIKGVYHINAVDEVTQMEVVCSVEKISEPRPSQYFKRGMTLKQLDEIVIAMTVTRLPNSSREPNKNSLEPSMSGVNVWAKPLTPSLVSYLSSVPSLD